MGYRPYKFLEFIELKFLQTMYWFLAQVYTVTRNSKQAIAASKFSDNIQGIQDIVWHK